MDTSQQIDHYQTLIVQYLSEHQDVDSDSEAYHRSLITDRESHHYQLLATGWATPSRYVDTLLIHVHIKPTGKVWLLENGTELHVAEDLVARGIPKTDIVLGFHPPQYRALSGYAVA
jgi:hypothetical protein